MKDSVKILIVEDQMIIATKLTKMLTALGFEVIGSCIKGEQALSMIENTLPDIIIMDIILKGSLNGIETSKLISAAYEIPIIYLTANTDPDYFEKAKMTNPYAFIAKPFKDIDLSNAIELTLHKMKVEAKNKEVTEKEQLFHLKDRIFIRNNDKMKKLMIESILFFEADRNYTKIKTTEREFIISIHLKRIEEKLPTHPFLRIHRSFIINCTKIDELEETSVRIGSYKIPMSRHSKKELVKLLNLI